MQDSVVIYFDIAAVVIMVVTFASLVLRRITSGPTSRVYMSAMSLVLVTAVVCLVGEVYDLYAASTQTAINTPAWREALTLIYYTLRTLTAPAYLILIATVSGTTHRLDRNNLVRLLLWGPMVAVVLLVLTNPLHHMVYYQLEGEMHVGIMMQVVYASGAYYSLIGIWWLIRWRSLLSSDEFYTLLALYPIILVSVAIQFVFPALHIEMFITSVSMMLISAFVIRPERRIDSLVGAGSLHSYREMCRRAFISEKPLCLVYLEIVNLERVRELVGKDELQDVVKMVAKNLTSRLEHDDALYYLRNGMFCISPRNIDVDHALRIARNAHEEGKAKSLAINERHANTEMRTCIVRAPEDVKDVETLKTFVRRFARLVPESGVTTYSELSEQPGFDLEMQLSDIIARAIDNRTFTVFYQPIYCVKDGKFHSAEALVRLSDPQFGWVPPALFITEAEANGTIVEIGEILLDKICAFLGTVDYEGTGLEYVEVNLSVDQCIRPEMAGDIVECLNKHGVEPGRINLEITETSASFSQEAIEANVKILAAEGVTFSLDDYGTGYSNVTRALSLPFSLVKLDKSFVDNLDQDAVKIVVDDTVAMMKSIGKNVLVEGVEDEAQAEKLINAGVDYIQGYYYAKPMPEDEFLDFLLSRNG